MNWGLLAITGSVGLVGVVLHEVTHWLLWRAQGRHAVFTLQGLQPVVVVPDATLSDVQRRDQIAAGAPLVIGVASAMLAVAIGVPVSLPAVGAWVGYTGVSVLDLQLAFGAPDAPA